MSKLSELRQRSKASKEQRVKRIQEAVTDVVNSSSFALTMMNHLEDEDVDTQQKQEEFVSDIVSKVASVVNDPKEAFLDVCRARNISERRIKRVVDIINELFNLTESEDYEEKLEAVSLYLQNNPNLYEDIGTLK